MEKVKEVSSKLNRRRWFRINFGMHVVFDGSWFVGCCTSMQAEDVGFTSILGHVVFRSCHLMEVARGCSRRQSRVNVCTTFFREWRRVLTLGVVPPAVFACDVLVLACDVLMSKDEVESQQCSERCEAGPILLEEQDFFLRCPDSRDVFI